MCGWKNVLWLRNAAGFSPSDRTDPLANFFFGGFGNNWVDHQAVKRYRSYYAFPGLELNEAGGANFVRTMLEWNLPPIRFKRAGTPDFYLSHIRPALFASSLVTNFNDDELRERSKNMGIQLDLQFTVKTRFPMTLSVGYAKAFGEADFEDDEWMVSLKIL